MSRRFVKLSQEQSARWLARPLGAQDLAVVVIDGIHFRDRVIPLALGIDAQGNKHVLGLCEGSTEAARVVASLLSDLIDRGVRFSAGRNRCSPSPGAAASLREGLEETQAGATWDKPGLGLGGANPLAMGGGKWTSPQPHARERSKPCPG